MFEQGTTVRQYTNDVQLKTSLELASMYIHPKFITNPTYIKTKFGRVELKDATLVDNGKFTKIVFATGLTPKERTMLETNGLTVASNDEVRKTILNNNAEIEQFYIEVERNKSSRPKPIKKTVKRKVKKKAKTKTVRKATTTKKPLAKKTTTKKAATTKKVAKKAKAKPKGRGKKAVK